MRLLRQRRVRAAHRGQDERPDRAPQPAQAGDAAAMGQHAAGRHRLPYGAGVPQAEQAPRTLRVTGGNRRMGPRGTLRRVPCGRPTGRPVPADPLGDRASDARVPRPHDAHLLARPRTRQCDRRKTVVAQPCCRYRRCGNDLGGGCWGPTRRRWASGTTFCRLRKARSPPRWPLSSGRTTRRPSPEPPSRSPTRCGLREKPGRNKIPPFNPPMPLT